MLGALDLCCYPPTVSFDHLVKEQLPGDAYTTLCKAAIRGSFLYPELFLTEYLNGAYKMLRTRFTEMLGLTYPIMSAPMTNHCGGILASAVSRAGGLGSFGGINGGSIGGSKRNENIRKYIGF